MHKKFIPIELYNVAKPPTVVDNGEDIGKMFDTLYGEDAEVALEIFKNTTFKITIRLTKDGIQEQTPQNIIMPIVKFLPHKEFCHHRMCNSYATNAQIRNRRHLMFVPECWRMQYFKNLWEKQSKICMIDYKAIHQLYSSIFNKTEVWFYRSLSYKPDMLLQYISVRDAINLLQLGRRLCVCYFCKKNIKDRKAVRWPWYPNGEWEFSCHRCEHRISAESQQMMRMKSIQQEEQLWLKKAKQQLKAVRKLLKESSQSQSKLPLKALQTADSFRE